MDFVHNKQQDDSSYLSERCRKCNASRPAMRPKVHSFRAPWAHSPGSISLAEKIYPMGQAGNELAMELPLKGHAIQRMPARNQFCRVIQDVSRFPRSSWKTPIVGLHFLLGNALCAA